MISAMGNSMNIWPCDQRDMWGTWNEWTKYYGSFVAPTQETNAESVSANWNHGENRIGLP